eukprot:TRINITY_DN21594_c0_g1_i4.p2 TRINITY_DN21594_c0_g1~~TRINITY_DN21594_c0_g1_i4.p2  ORF type:complete len:160 (+),score=10.54 TRINITY_DN21594_c0_g1_i4:150-629(+)
MTRAKTRTDPAVSIPGSGNCRAGQCVKAGACDGKMENDPCEDPNAHATARWKMTRAKTRTILPSAFQAAAIVGLASVSRRAHATARWKMTRAKTRTILQCSIPGSGNCRAGQCVKAGPCDGKMENDPCEDPNDPAVSIPGSGNCRAGQCVNTNSIPERQ